MDDLLIGDGGFPGKLWGIFYSIILITFETIKCIYKYFLRLRVFDLDLFLS